jgi:hypothetical protein
MKKETMTEFQIQIFLENNYRLALEHPDPVIRRMALGRLADIQRRKKESMPGKQTVLCY